jgi:hypothetical protein
MVFVLNAFLSETVQVSGFMRCHYKQVMLCVFLNQNSGQVQSLI